MFLDVFSNDYIKVIKAIERKKITQRGNQDDYGQKIPGINGTGQKGIGNEAKFGKKRTIANANLRQSVAISEGDNSNDEVMNEKHKKTKEPLNT